MGEPGLVAARIAAYATMLPAAGLPLYLLTAGRGIVITGRLRRGVALLALLALAASIWLTLASVAAMAAIPVSGLDSDMLGAVLAATPLGSVLVIRALTLTALAIAACRRAPVALLATLGTIALASFAWTGHAGSTEGGLGLIHRLADAAHLLAAATWLGGLAMLTHALFAPLAREEHVRRLASFATTGTMIVALMLATGIANTIFIVRWPSNFATLWTQLLAVKITMFAAMLALAALNRWRLTPALEAGDHRSIRALRLSLCTETAAALAIVAVVAWLGTLDPAD